MPIPNIEFAAYRRRLREQRVADGLCANCGKAPIVKGWLCEVHRQYNLEYSKRANAKIRDEIITAYGGLCKCCEESGRPFLTIDHINNDGAAHRKTVSHGGATFYRWLKKQGFPPDFQLLCWNCNAAKQHNGGVCPHQTGISKSTSINRPVAQ